MGEIKSTLELVMERTKHMTLSDEEKKAQELKDYQNHCNGLIQKLLDSSLNLEQFERDFEKLKSPPDCDRTDVLSGLILERIDLENDEGALFAVLRLVCLMEIKNLSKVIDDHRETVKAAMQKRTGKIRKKLKKKYAVYGSSIVPNMDLDEEWAGESRKIRSKFENRLDMEKKRLRL